MLHLGVGLIAEESLHIARRLDEAVLGVVGHAGCPQLFKPHAHHVGPHLVDNDLLGKEVALGGYAQQAAHEVQVGVEVEHGGVAV